MKCKVILTGEEFGVDVILAIALIKRYVISIDSELSIYTKSKNNEYDTYKECIIINNSSDIIDCDSINKIFNKKDKIDIAMDVLDYINNNKLIAGYSYKKIKELLIDLKENSYDIEIIKSIFEKNNIEYRKQDHIFLNENLKNNIEFFNKNLLGYIDNMALVSRS